MVQRLLTFGSAILFLVLISYRAINMSYSSHVAFGTIGAVALGSALMLFLKPRNLRVVQAGVKFSLAIYLVLAVFSAPLAYAYFGPEELKFIDLGSLALLTASILSGFAVYRILCSPHISPKGFIVTLLTLPLFWAVARWILIISGVIEASPKDIFSRWGGDQIILVGWFTEPSELAGHLGLCLGIALFGFKRHLSYTLVAFISVCLLLTGSMTGAGFLILIGVLSMGIYFRPKRSLMLMILLMVIVYVLMFKYRFVIDRFLNSIYLRDNSVNVRLLTSWQGVVDIIKADWGLIGVGVGNYKEFVGSLHPDIPGGGRSWNVLAIVFATTGVLGVLSFLTMHIRILFNNWRIGVLLLAYGFTTGAAHTPLYWAYFFLCLYFSRAKIAAYHFESNRKGILGRFTKGCYRGLRKPTEDALGSLPNVA